MEGGDEGLDALLQEVQQSKKRESQRRDAALAAATTPPATASAATAAAATTATVDKTAVDEDDGWDDWGEEDDDNGAAGAQTEGGVASATTAWEADARGEAERVVHFRGELRRFMEDLCDSFRWQSVNEELACVRYDSFVHYFQQRAGELSEYTVEQEIGRMDYTVCYEGVELREVDDIRESFQRTNLRHPDIWSMANQSLYSELLGVLQALLRADLCMTLVSKDCSFYIDIDKAELRSDSHFELCTTTTDATGLLELARIDAHVRVRLNDKVLTQTIDVPQVSPIFDDVLDQAAQALAQQAAMDGQPDSISVGRLGPVGPAGPVSKRLMQAGSMVHGLASAVLQRASSAATAASSGTDNGDTEYTTGSAGTIVSPEERPGAAAMAALTSDAPPQGGVVVDDGDVVAAEVPNPLSMLKSTFGLFGKIGGTVMQVLESEAPPLPPDEETAGGHDVVSATPDADAAQDEENSPDADADPDADPAPESPGGDTEPGEENTSS